MSSPSRGLRSVRCRVYRQHVISETNRYIKNYTRKTAKTAIITAVRPLLFSADAAPCVTAGRLFVAEAVLLPCVDFRVLEGWVEEVVITDPFEVEVAKDPFGVEADRRVEDGPEAAIPVLDRPGARVAPEDFPAVPEDSLVVSEDPLVGFSEDSSELLEGFSKVPLMVLEDFPAAPEDFLVAFEDSLVVFDDSSVVLDGFSVALLDSLVDSFAELSVSLDARPEIDDRLVLVGRSVGIRVFVALLELLIVSTFFFKVSQ